MKRLLPVLVGACAVALLPAVARGDTPTAPSPEAVAAFDEGRKLMAAGDVKAAIVKFEESVHATRTVGALMNLGRAYEQVGRTASAWAVYRAAGALARELHDAREADAARYASAILPHVSHLTIDVADASAAGCGAGLEVTCDGAPAPCGEAIPVDAGKHTVAVRAPSKRPWSTSVDVGADGASASVHVPALEDQPTAPTATESPSPAPLPPAPAPASGASHTFGWVSMGVGGVGAVVGSVFGGLAIAKHSQAVAACSSYPDNCPSNGAADGPNHDAQTDATVSTTAFAIGGAGLALGTILLLTSPSSSPEPTTGAGPHLTFVAGQGFFGGFARGEW